MCGDHPLVLRSECQVSALTALPAAVSVLVTPFLRKQSRELSLTRSWSWRRKLSQDFNSRSFSFLPFFHSRAKVKECVLPA